MTIQRRLITWLTIIVAGWWAIPATAQIRVELPELPMQRMGMGTIMDGEIVFNGSSRSVSVHIENGVKKIHAKEDGIKTYIEEDPDQGIKVEITKPYTLEQLNEIRDEYPNLYMYLEGIPTEVDGAKVELTISLTRSYEAASAEELKEKHPVAFEAYENYTASETNMQLFERRFGADQLAPHFEMDPRGRGILQIPSLDPDDVRIHDEEDFDQDEKRSKDRSGQQDQERSRQQDRDR